MRYFLSNKVGIPHWLIPSLANPIAIGLLMPSKRNSNVTFPSI